MTEEVPEDEPIVETAKENPEAVDVEKVVSLLDADDGIVRNGALIALAHVAVHDADLVADHTDVFIDSLDDGLAGSEVKAAEILQRIAANDPEAVQPAIPKLVDKLGEQPPLKSFKAAAVLGHLLAYDPEAFVEHADAFVDVVEEPPDHGIPTDEELEEMPEEEAREVRERLASRADQAQKDVERTYGVRELAANVLVEISDREPEAVADRVEDLRPAIHGEPPIARTATLDVVANVAEADPDAVDPLVDDLIERASEGTTTVRVHAIKALGYASSPEAVEPLRDVAADDDPEVDEDLQEMAAETADFIESNA